MSLIRLDEVSLAFGEHPLLDKISLNIDHKDRLFLIGRNGMGKSTLFKVLLDYLQLDDGSIYRAPYLKVGELAQNLPSASEHSVYDLVAEGLGSVGKLLQDYQHLTKHPLDDETLWLEQLSALQSQIDADNGWLYQQSIEQVLTLLQLNGETRVRDLSGGWQRRVLMARSLVASPNLLLLDEPTNHLDIEGILWLENFLSHYTGAFVCITHDRALLNRLATHIVELDRGHIKTYPGNFEQFQARKQHELEVEQQQQALFDKKLALEETWIRQGVKARRTRNEGRVRALKALRAERAERRDLQGRPQFAANTGQMTGKQVVKLEHIHFAYGDDVLIEDFSGTIFRQDKIALVGPNGVGKSTFLKCLLGQLKPTRGKVTLGTQLDIGYFDQHRSSFELDKSAIDNVAGGRSHITHNGKERHVIGFLQDFLFTPERARTPVKMLSGGERSRLLLAQLFAKASNVLVLDEPTNDLDLESLELLEALLVEYTGTVLLVSHDRQFINNIATHTYLFRGEGEILPFVGGYEDIPGHYLANTKKPTAIETPSEAVKLKAQSSTSNTKPNKIVQKLLNDIASLESDEARLLGLLADMSQKQATQTPDFMRQSKELSALQDQLKSHYAEWERLEGLDE